MGCCFSFLCCCDETPGSARKSRRGRQRRRGTRKRNSNGLSYEDSNGAYGRLSDGEDYHSCKDDFSSTDGAPLSPLDSPPATSQRGRSPSLGRCKAPIPALGAEDSLQQGLADWHANQQETWHTAGAASNARAARQTSADGTRPHGTTSFTSTAVQPQDADNQQQQHGSLHTSSTDGSHARTKHAASEHGGGGNPARHVSQRRQLGTGSGLAGKLDAGTSLQPRDMSKPFVHITDSYEDGDGLHYRIRSLDYMKTKVKVKSACSIYRLVSADVVWFERKQNHIAQLVNLPPTPAPVHKLCPSSDACFPPMLVVNLQLPSYSPSIFGGTTDGPGWSIIYYFALPDDFDPSTFPNQKALGLFRRFVQNGREADGAPTRERFKMIPRVVNVDEWAHAGHLSAAEHKLTSTYNEKPVLTRPQQLFFRGPSYLEVDIDLHTYTFLARKAIASFMSRLKPVVWEVAFVVQGNTSDELPEQVLACARVYRTDFTQPRTFSSLLTKTAPVVG